jgi:hypothetical protein
MNSRKTGFGGSAALETENDNATAKAARNRPRGTDMRWLQKDVFELFQGYLTMGFSADSNSFSSDDAIDTLEM